MGGNWVLVASGDMADGSCECPRTQPIKAPTPAPAPATRRPRPVFSSDWPTRETHPTIPASAPITSPLFLSARVFLCADAQRLHRGTRAVNRCHLTLVP